MTYTILFYLVIRYYFVYKEFIPIGILEKCKSELLAFFKFIYSLLVFMWDAEIIEQKQFRPLKNKYTKRRKKVIFCEGIFFEKTWR